MGTAATLAALQVLQTALRSEALVRRGLLDRRRQRRLILACALESLHDGISLALVIAPALLVLPWLRLPLGVLGSIGLGRLGLELAQSLWQSLDPGQQADLHVRAYAAGVNLRRLIQTGYSSS